MILAYVFWHWSDAPRGSYEDRLRAFHRALAADPPRGFLRSEAFGIDDAPWLPQPSAYEDWYWTTGFADLEHLRDAAVSGSRKEPHDEVARAARAGTAGVYELVAGEPSAAATRFAVWLSKPAGTSYERLLEEARPWLEADGAVLWQRQMVLGPAPEFCLRSVERIAVGDRWAPIEIPLRPL